MAELVIIAKVTLLFLSKGRTELKHSELKSELIILIVVHQTLIENDQSCRVVDLDFVWLIM